jgi:hypothetical protein
MHFLSTWQNIHVSGMTGLDTNQQTAVLYPFWATPIADDTGDVQDSETACLGRVQFRRMKTYGTVPIQKPFSLSATTEEVWLLFGWYPIRVWVWTPVILIGFLHSLCTEYQNGIHLNSYPINSNLQSNDSCPSPDKGQTVLLSNHNPSWYSYKGGNGWKTNMALNS